MTDYRADSRFSDLVEAYSRYRYRDYPSKVFDVIFRGLGDPKQTVVADIGAGTGISAALIASRGAKVIAIEPNERMRAHAPHHASIEWRDGTAEATGLDDGSVDVVTAFQAFHWFDPAGALAEFRRIARRRIVNVQYEHEESDAPSAEINRLLCIYSVDDSERLRRHALETFAALAGDRLRTSILNVDWNLSREGLLGYLDSISFVPHNGVLGDRLRAEVAELFRRHQREGILTLPLRLYVLALDVA